MTASVEAKWTTVTNWAALVGQWNFSTGVERYEGPGHNPAPDSHGVALSGARFKDGIIRAEVSFEASDDSPSLKGETTNGCSPLKGESGGILFGYQPGSAGYTESGGYCVAGLGAFDRAYGIWEYVPGSGWSSRKAAGMIQNLKYNETYSLEVHQKGQRVSLTVNGILVLDHLLQSPPPGNQLGLYAMSRSPVRFKNYEVQRQAPTAFVAMQFGEPYDTIYGSVIKPEAEALGFAVERIDEVYRPGIIFQDIQQRIGDAKVVIAEITAPNQNVYYEVGYAHALNKPTILLAQRGRDLPFDIRSYRVIFYDDSIGGKPAVERTLREHLHSILNEL